MCVAPSSKSSFTIAPHILSSELVLTTYRHFDVHQLLAPLALSGGEVPVGEGPHHHAEVAPLVLIQLLLLLVLLLQHWHLGRRREVVGGGSGGGQHRHEEDGREKAHSFVFGGKGPPVCTISQTLI